MPIRGRVLASLALLSFGAAAIFGSYPARGAVYTVTVGTGTVDGKPTKILADAKGFALYWLSSDKAGMSACTGGCTATWPPLLSIGMPTASTSLPGKLAVIHTANGAQVAYNGHLLYRYARDAKPGQVNGDDQKGPAGGEWYAVTPFKTASTAPAPTAPTGWLPMQERDTDLRRYQIADRGQLALAVREELPGRGIAGSGR